MADGWLRGILDRDVYWPFFFSYVVLFHMKVLSNYHGHSSVESMYSSFSLSGNVSTTHLKSKKFCFSPRFKNEVWKWDGTPNRWSFQVVLVPSNIPLGNVSLRSESISHQVTNIYHVATLCQALHLTNIRLSPELGQTCSNQNLVHSSLTCLRANEPVSSQQPVWKSVVLLFAVL